MTRQGLSLEVDVTVLEQILAVIWQGSTVFYTCSREIVTAVRADVTIAGNLVVMV
jgi:hypothetical protein